MDILQRWTKKRGIEDINEASPDDQKLYEQYKTVLRGREITSKDIENFIKSQIGAVESKWRDLDLSTERKSELIPYHTAYKSILAVLTAPEAERAALETYLASQV